jgi:PAS domain S-box-containing protein
LNAEIAHPGRGDLTLSGFVAAACVAIVLVGAAYWVSLQQSRAAAWVSHTHEVLATIARTRAALVDIQNGHRGFTISGEERELEPYRTGRAAIAIETARLRELLADDPAHRAQLAELDRVISARLASAAQLVEARRQGGFGAAKAIVDTGLPGEQMTRLRDILHSLEAEEQQLLRERLADHERRLHWFWAGMTAVVVLLVSALAVLYLQVRRRRATQQALLESEHRFQLMTNSVVEYLIVMLDLDGRVRTWNSGAERITGYRGEEMIVGRDFSCFYSHDDVHQGKPTRTLEMAAAQGRFVEEGWLVRSDGSAFWASLVMTPMRDRHGDLRGFCMIARDLTERKRAEEALHAQMQERRRIDDELQRLNRSLEGLVRERTAELRSANDDLLEAKQRLRDLSSQLIWAQEQERRLIARELHDDTAQALTVIRMHLTDVLRGVDGTTARVPDCIAVVDSAIAQIRAMALHLRPTMLDDLGLADALEWVLDQQGTLAGWEAALEVDDDVPLELPADVQTACFRIAQEALTNAARHARATHVKVQLRMAADALELTVSDDGTGFDLEHYRTPEERRKHFGLMSMTERAGLVGGSLDVVTSSGAGTRIRATLPIAAEARIAVAAAAGAD